MWFTVNLKIMPASFEDLFQSKERENMAKSIEITKFKNNCILLLN